jgi:hypothetical protein
VPFDLREKTIQPYYGITEDRLTRYYGDLRTSGVGLVEEDPFTWALLCLTGLRYAFSYYKAARSGSECETFYAPATGWTTACARLPAPSSNGSCAAHAAGAVNRAVMNRKKRQTYFFASLRQSALPSKGPPNTRFQPTALLVVLASRRLKRVPLWSQTLLTKITYTPLLYV